MHLAITDMRAVLQARTAGMVSKKASEDPTDILAGVADIRTVLNEMENYANNLIVEREKLEQETSV
jgi:hypothetical protein